MGNGKGRPQRRSDAAASGFDYGGRAAEAQAARDAIRQTFRQVTRRHDPGDPATAAWLAAIERARVTRQAAFPPGFQEAYDRLRRRDASGLELALRFLEADPYFPESGYMKANLVRFIRRLPLSAEDVRRLQGVVLRLVDRRASQVFRRYCQLANRIDNPELRQELVRRLADPEPGIRRRSAWMLAVIDSSRKAKTLPELAGRGVSR